MRGAIAVEQVLYDRSQRQFEGGETLLIVLAAVRPQPFEAIARLFGGLGVAFPEVCQFLPPPMPVEPVAGAAGVPAPIRSAAVAREEFRGLDWPHFRHRVSPDKSEEQV